MKNQLKEDLILTAMIASEMLLIAFSVFIFIKFNR
jgi:hypothetical protein